MGIKTVRDMASALRLEVDSRRRKVDEALSQVNSNVKQLDDKMDTNVDNIHRYMDDNHTMAMQRVDERVEHSRSLDNILARHVEIHQEIHSKMDGSNNTVETRISKLEAELRKQDEDMH